MGWNARCFKVFLQRVTVTCFVNISVKAIGLHLMIGNSVQKKETKMFSLLQNSGDSNKILYTVSRISRAVQSASLSRPLNREIGWTLIRPYIRRPRVDDQQPSSDYVTCRPKPNRAAAPAACRCLVCEQFAGKSITSVMLRLALRRSCGFE